jgi:LPS export ABC transporter protein LptC
MRRLLLHILALPAVAIVVVLACSPTEKVATSSDNDSVLVPDATGHGLNIYLYDQGEVTAEIESETMVKFEKLDSTMAREVDVTAYDSTGQRNGHLVGDSAVIREKTGRMDIYGDVVFVAEDGTTLKTDYLRWNPNTSQIETESFVRITRGRDWATGWILRADQNLKRWVILKDFQGTFFGMPPGTTDL